MPPTLNYDTLPPGSDIRYELDANSIRITVPASDTRITFPIDELPLHLRRTVLRQSIVAPALFAAALIASILCVIPFMSFSSPERFLLIIAVVIFGLALFALLLHLFYLARRDTLTTGRRQFTLIDASPDQLLIESAGPFGTQSLDVDPQQIRAIKVARLPHRPPVQIAHAVAFELPNETLYIAPARLHSELTWIAQSLRDRMPDPAE